MSKSSIKLDNLSSEVYEWSSEIHELSGKMHEISRNVHKWISICASAQENCFNL